MIEAYYVRSVERSLQLLKCFDKEHQAIGLLEFAGMLELNKSTVFRLLCNLADSGFVEINEDGKYVLGQEIFRLARVYQNSDLLAKEAESLMKKVAALSGETVAIAEYSNGNAICVNRIESNYPLKIVSEIGASVPLIKGATGKAIIAFLPQEERKRCWARQEEMYHYGIEFQPLEEELAKVRERGYVITDGEVDIGVVAIAAPIFGNNRRVLGSISVAGPNNRFTNEKAEVLKDNLTALSDALLRKYKI